jgi:hypothetical protein
MAYVVDCYRDKTAEAAAPPKLMQTLFAFGFTYYVNDWPATSGPGPFSTPSEDSFLVAMRPLSSCTIRHHFN